MCSSNKISMAQTKKCEENILTYADMSKNDVPSHYLEDNVESILSL